MTWPDAVMSAGVVVCGAALVPQVADALRTGRTGVVLATSAPTAVAMAAISVAAGAAGLSASCALDALVAAMWAALAGVRIVSERTVHGPCSGRADPDTDPRPWT